MGLGDVFVPMLVGGASGRVFTGRLMCEAPF